MDRVRSKPVGLVPTVFYYNIIFDQEDISREVMQLHFLTVRFFQRTKPQIVRRLPPLPLRRLHLVRRSGGQILGVWFQKSAEG